MAGFKRGLGEVIWCICSLKPKSKNSHKVIGRYLQAEQLQPSLKAANALVSFSPQEGNRHLYLHSLTGIHGEGRAQICPDVPANRKNAVVNRNSNILLRIHNLRVCACSRFNPSWRK